MIEIPKNWNELTLQKGKSLLLLDTTGLTESDYYTQAYYILTEKELEGKQLADVSKIKEEINSLLSTPLPQKLEYKYTIQGEEYFLEYDLTRITWAEFMDIEMIMEKNKNSIMENIEQILAILIRKKKTPIQKKKKFKWNFIKYKREEVEILNYELEDYDFNSRLERARLFLKGINMSQVMSLILFFYLIEMNYLIQIKRYSQETIQQSKEL